MVALIVAAVMWTSEPKYKVLFSNLEDRDGGAIVTALGQMNVPYRYNENGTALLVPADRVYDARLQLASQGLPRGGSVGFELMDNARFGASQFAEQINYQRGLEGELARSIESMHTVQHARVHLAMPRQSLFVRERQAPTASVLLNLYPGRSLSDAQVSAISWLVASSVPELTAENVSVVDQNGRLLSAPLGEGRGMDADQLRFVREMEQRTVERILTILNPLVGPGNVHAQASAEMDFARREETSEVYRPNQEPGQGAIRSQQTSDATQRGIGPAQGVPGALSNQPPGNAQAPITNPQQPPARPGQTPQQQGAQQQTGAQAASGSLNERRDATTNYEVDRTISHVKQPVGALKRLSVAVVVNYIRDKDGDLAAAARGAEQADQPGPRGHGLFRRTRRLAQSGQQPVQRRSARPADVARSGNDRPVQDHHGLAAGLDRGLLAVPQGASPGHRLPVPAGRSGSGGIRAHRSPARGPGNGPRQGNHALRGQPGTRPHDGEQGSACRRHGPAHLDEQR